jgi:hypothetical protein
MGVLGGSIEAGQDPSYTTTDDRRKRSGFAKHVGLYYFTSYGYPDLGSDTLLVVQDAVSKGLDILNLSWNYNCVCNTTCDDGGANAAIRNATNAGVLLTVAAGNDGASSCKVAWPSTSRDVLTVGGLNTASYTYNYDTTNIWTSSSRGGMDLKVNGLNHAGAAAVVDIVAPAKYTLLYRSILHDPDFAWYASETDSGTSFAAPSVAGSIAMMMNSIYGLGINGMDARTMLAYTIMMGDGWDADSGVVTGSGMSSLSGAGRLKAHYMGSGLTAPSGFGCHEWTISNGHTITYNVGGFGAESSSITTWKAALVWDEPDPTNVGDIVFRVKNTCPDSLVRVDASYDVRKRLRLSQSEIGGKCLKYEVEAFNIPSDRTFAVCDYYQSGNPGDH